MRVLYSGGTICSIETLKRLVLLADEIAFMDRPSVAFGNFGTVGRDSEFRQFRFDDAPVFFQFMHRQTEKKGTYIFGTSKLI